MSPSKLVFLVSVVASLASACGDDAAKQPASPSDQSHQDGSVSKIDGGILGSSMLDADLSKVHVDASLSADGGAAVGDAALTCEQQSHASALELAAARDSADTHCSVDDDCTAVYFSTPCFASCSGVLSKQGAAQVAAATTPPVSATCAGFSERGCVAVAPPCIAAPSFACVHGSCTGFQLDGRQYGAETTPLMIDENYAGEVIALAVGQQLELTLHTIGPGNYLDPQLSSAALALVSSSYPSGQNPGGPTQLYIFKAVSVGDVDLTIAHSTKPTPFTLTIAVR